MTEQVFATTDKLSEVIGNMQKCLQCTICLHTISDPVKTLCGHRFCRKCIQRVVQNKRSRCPLCSTAIQRRSISTDEHMVLYIDRLNKLIEAIQMDSGIDVLSHLSRPQSTRESYSSDNTEYCKNDTEELDKPSCSFNVTSQKNQPVSRSNRNKLSQRRSKNQKNKKKMVQKEGSSITKYLSKYSLSGIEPLAADESNDYPEEQSMEDKVHSWLETLPKGGALDDPNKSAPMQSAECDLDDTLTISVSQNCENNKPGNFDTDIKVVVDENVKNTGRSLKERCTRSPSRDENNEKKSNKNRRKSSDARAVESYASKMDFDVENPKPSTSGVTRLNDNSKEKSQERHSDVHKTSPCDMLPTMKNNWYSVAKFGKEMRTRRKKLKSLDVSIENKGKPRFLNEPLSSNKEEVVGSKVVEHAVSRKRRKGDGLNKSQRVSTTTSDKGFLGKKGSLAEIEGISEKEGSPGNRRYKLMSEKVQLVGESSFITLKEGEQVHIRNLSSCQMNDIIGVTEKVRRAGVKDDATNNREEIAFPTEKQVDPPVTPPEDRVKIFSQSTPVKPAEIQDREILINESSDKKGDSSPALTKGIGTIDESYFATKLQASASGRKRLSLRRSDELKLDDSSGSNADSRLQGVRRDLNRQIEQGEGSADVNKRSVEGIIGKGENRSAGGDKQDGGRGGALAATSSGLTSRIRENRRHDGSLITFKKLGMFCKHRKKHVSFLYLGTTRRMTMLNPSYPKQELQKPSNPVDASVMQGSGNDYTSGYGFGNDVLITVNDTPEVEPCEVENVIPAKRMKPTVETKSISKIEDASKSGSNVGKQRGKMKETKETREMNSVESTVNNVPIECQDLEVVFLSMDEKEETLPRCVKDSAKSAKTTPSKNVVKLLSPSEDSQLRFLTLESPTMDELSTQKLTHKPEPTKDSTPKKSNLLETNKAPSKVLARIDQASASSGSPCIPNKKRKRSNSQDKFSHRIQWISEDDDDKDDPSSNRSFSSQTTCIRNSDNVASASKNNTLNEKCKLSAASTKDIDTVSLSSSMDIAAGGKKKVYKRIVPLASSDTDSVDPVCVNKLPNDQPGVSPTPKRKRAVSPDSDGEADLNVIVSSWYEQARPTERCKKKGKLERARDSSNSMNASFEARDKSSSKSTDRNKPANKLSTLQRRHPSELAGNSDTEKSNSAGTRLRKNVENRGTIVDEDSPDFGSTIDMMKDIRNKGMISDGKREIAKDESLMQDNFDEIIANVDTGELIDAYDDGKESKSNSGSIEWLEVDGRERIPGQRKSSAVDSDGSGKETRSRKVLYNSNGDEDKTLTPVHINVVDKNSKKDKIQEKPVGSTAMESMRIREDIDIICSDDKKVPVDQNVGDDSMVKDTYDQDSLMNITQHYLMFKQFEEDLFGKPLSSNDLSGKEQRTPQNPKKSKQRSKANDKDVEHSGEEDDIVENTPDTKTKKTPSSTTGRSSISVNSPVCKRSIHPLYQSTPKTQHSSSKSHHSSANLASIVNESSKKEMKSIAINSVQNIQNAQNVRRQDLCFVCSGMVPPQIENVKRLAQAVNARYVTQFAREVTHVIVRVDSGNNGANKTLKYLQGIAHRKWIVSYQWVMDSLKERKLISEEPYEAVDCRTLEAGPRKSRLREKGLFEGFAFLCIGPYADVSVEQYQDLLRATGAIVVDSLSSLTIVNSRLKIIVIQAEVYEYDIIEWYKTAHALPIVHDWVVECISQYKLISFYPYLQEFSSQDVLKLGYPEYLVEEDPDGDSDSMCDVSA